MNSPLNLAVFLVPPASRFSSIKYTISFVCFLLGLLNSSKVVNFVSEVLLFRLVPRNILWTMSPYPLTLEPVVHVVVTLKRVFYLQTLNTIFIVYSIEIPPGVISVFD